MIFYINHHLKDYLAIDFTAIQGELITEKALTSFAVLTHIASSQVKYDY